MTSRTASTHTKGTNGEILLRLWSRRQMSPSCGELLKELMAEQNMRQSTKQLLSMEARSHRSSSLQPGSTNRSNTSKLGRHTSSSETRLVTRETKRKSFDMVQTFTTDLMRSAIKSCRNSKTFGPDKLSIFHMKYRGPRTINISTSQSRLVRFRRYGSFH